LGWEVVVVVVVVAVVVGVVVVAAAAAVPPPPLTFSTIGTKACSYHTHHGHKSCGLFKYIRVREEREDIIEE